jgi:hypothetical protein
MKAFASSPEGCEPVAEAGRPLVEPTGGDAPEIPTLAAVFNPVTMAWCLRQALPNASAAILDIQFQILRRHRRRCTFDIAWQTAAGWGGLIGKVYAADREDVYRAMLEIRRRGFGPEAEFSIPEPLAYVLELHLLLQEKVQGARVKEIFLTGDERERAAAAQRCARWLARFHAAAPRLGPVYRLDEHLESLHHWSRSLAELGGAVADKATRLGAQLAAAAQGMGIFDLCAGHGHYTCGQVLLAGGRTVTFDWDDYDVADPCRDVADFLVALRRIGLKHPAAVPALDQAADIFQTTYVASNRPDGTSHLAFQKAALCLKRARRDARKQEAGWRDRAAATLDDGLRALAREW